MRAISTVPASLLLVFVLGLPACSSFSPATETLIASVNFAKPGPPPLHLRPLVATPRSVFTRSYRIGETYTARVGEPMLSVKNYMVTERVGRATALRDIEQLCDRVLRKESAPCSKKPLSAVRAGMGSVFEVPGAISTPDGNYFALLVPVPDSQDLVYLLVDPKGRLRRGAYVAWWEAGPRDLRVAGIPLDEVTPELPLDTDSALFSFENQQSFSGTGAGYLNFDLVYAGSKVLPRGETVFLNYREYAREATDQLLFEQHLRYSSSDTNVEVGGLRLHIDAAGPDSITFTVVEDSAAGAERP